MMKELKDIMDLKIRIMFVRDKLHTSLGDLIEDFHQIKKVDNYLEESCKELKNLEEEIEMLLDGGFCC